MINLLNKIYTLFNFIIFIIKTYLNILSFLLTLLFFYIFYITLSIQIFVFLLFLVLIFCNILIYYKYNLFNVENRFITLILNKDYTYIIQKVVLIKFMIFYVYLSTNYSYCGSFITETMHDIFIGMGKNIGVQPKTTVSTLETIGGITLFAGGIYCGYKGYQYMTNTYPKSTNEKLDELERRLNNRLDNIELNLNNKIEETRLNLIDAHATFDRENIARFSLVELGFNVTNENINNLRNDINDLKQIIVQNQQSYNKLVKDELNKNMKNIENLINKHQIYADRNVDTLSEAERENLSKLQQELTTLLQSNNEIVTNLPVEVKTSTSLTTNSAPTSPIIFNIRRNSFSANSLQQNALHMQNLRNIPSTPPIRQRSVPELPPVSASTTSTLHGKTFKVTDISDNKIVLTSVIPGIITEPIKMVGNIFDTGISRIFTGVSTEMLIRFTIAGISKVLEGSMVGTTLIGLLNIFGLGSGRTTHIPSTSENMGRSVGTTLRDMFNGIISGWNKK